MNYGSVKYCDIANGEGVRTSLFVSGCRHRCLPEFSAHFFRTKFRELGKRRARRWVLQKMCTNSFCQLQDRSQRRIGIGAISFATAQEATACPPAEAILFDRSVATDPNGSCLEAVSCSSR